MSYKGKSYYIQKRILIDDVADLNGLKRWYNPDVLLTKNGYYHFCREIEEAKIIWIDNKLGDEIFRVNHLPDDEYKILKSKRKGRQKRKMKR